MKKQRPSSYGDPRRENQSRDRRDDKRGDKRAPFEKSSREKPSRGKPAYGKPAYAKASDEGSAQARPSRGKPPYGKPAYAKAFDERPAQGRPSRGKPAYGKPSYARASDDGAPQGRPSRGKPSYGKPSYTRSSEDGAPQGRPSRGKPPYGKPSYARASEDGAPQGRPSRGKPSYGKPAYGKPAYAKTDGKPSYGKPSRDRPAYGKPPREKSAARPPRQESIEERGPKPDRSGHNGVLIWGLHAVRAAWLNPKRRCFRLWLTEGAAETFASAMTEANEILLKRPDPAKSERHVIDRLVPPGSVHQGIVLEAESLAEPHLHELIGGDTPPDCLVVLDQVTDPHNIGAILRSAAALGAGGVILTERNAPSMTGVLAKSASGAVDHIPQIHVVNLARALDELREAGYWCVGLAEEGPRNLDASDLSGRTALVFGAEGEGLRQLTRKKCDELAKLPTGGPIGSLNVSNAVAVALYEARRQKTKS